MRRLITQNGFFLVAPLCVSGADSAETRVSPRANDRALAWDARCSFSARNFFRVHASDVGVVPTSPANVIHRSPRRRIVEMRVAVLDRFPNFLPISFLRTLLHPCRTRNKCLEARTAQSFGHELPRVCHSNTHIVFYGYYVRDTRLDLRCAFTGSFEFNSDFEGSKNNKIQDPVI